MSTNLTTRYVGYVSISTESGMPEFLIASDPVGRPGEVVHTIPAVGGVNLPELLSAAKEQGYEPYGDWRLDGDGDVTIDLLPIADNTPLSVVVQALKGALAVCEGDEDNIPTPVYVGAQRLLERLEERHLFSTITLGEYLQEMR